MKQPVDRMQPIGDGRTALLIIDVQNATYNDDVTRSEPYFYTQASSVVIPNLTRLLTACRRAEVEIIYTTMESLTIDGRDRSLDYKLSNFNFPKGCWEAQVLAQVRPGKDEIVIPKTSSSLFNSTNFEYVLRNIGISQVLVTGFLTDQCVDHTIRDGADRGFLMICVEDGCTTKSAERHNSAIDLFKGYCRLTTTQKILEEIGFCRKLCRVTD